MPESRMPFVILIVAVMLWFPVEMRAHQRDDQQRVRAGAGKADITPPAGLATGGYGPAGAIARGHLTRLYARAIFIRIGGTPLLLVSVDSFAVPQAFRAELPRRIQDQLDVPMQLPLESIVISATHTHHGPGNYLSAEVYNNHGSIVGRYVPQLREFLLHGITQASVRAINSAHAPAETSIQVRRGVLPEAMLRNRSPETFMLNRSAAKMMDELSPIGPPVTRAECLKARFPDEQDGQGDIQGCPRLRALDRSLTVLDIRHGRETIAMAVFGAVHPTVLPPKTPLFSGDFIGVALRRIEREESRKFGSATDSSDKFVAAFFNGAEGDVTTRRVRRDLRDLWHHADLFHDAVRSAEPLTLDVTHKLQARSYFAKPGASISPHARLAARARGGAASFGGAEGDRTILYDLGWREGATSLRATEEDGTKRNALDSDGTILDFTFVAAKDWDFPRALPFSLIELGDLDIVTSPTELSTATGYAIRHRVRPDAPDRVIVIGLANEYASYTASVDEYPRQDYMAASTLWGPTEAAFIVEALGNLKHNAYLPPPGQPVDDPGPKARGNLREHDVGARRQSVDEDLDPILRDQDGNPVRDLPFFLWEECRSSDAYKRTVERDVVIERADGVIVDDDSSGRLIVLLREKPRDGTTSWATIWAGTLAGPTSDQTVRFVVRSRQGIEHSSAWFDPTEKGERGRAECKPKR